MNRTERNGGGTSKAAIMNKEMVLDLISVISRSNDKTVIYKALVKLRTDLIHKRAGFQLFQECDGIPPLVRLIGKPYERILDVALSILGNCCTTKACCKQAISYGVVPPLLTILKSIPSTSVQCRACRLIGNLARESNEKICSLAKGIGIAIAAILEDNKDVNTLNMAVRAARLLWNEMPFYEEFVRHDGVRKIIAILVRHSQIEQQEPTASKSVVEMCPEERGRVDFMEEHVAFMESVNSKVFDREILKKTKPPSEESFHLTAVGGGCKDLNDLFTEILRSLQIITNGQSLRVIYEFYVNEYGCKCIVFFAKHDSPFRAQALKILSNLSKCENSTKFLSRADAVTTACSLITREDLPQPLSQAEEKHCISIICFLAGDACNRAKIRMSGAFTRIMEIAKNTKCDTVLTMILIGLQSFKYDNISIDLMIKIGLINVLVERLDLCTRDLAETHAKVVASAAVKRLGGATCSMLAATDGIDGNDGDEDASLATVVAAAEPTPKKRSKYDFAMAMSPVPMAAGSSSSPPIKQFNFYSYPNSPCSSSTSISRNPGDDGEDMDSEYSPVCSDIEDTTDDVVVIAATSNGGDSDQKNGCAGGDRMSTSSTSMSVLKLLDECGRVEREDLDDATVQSTDEGADGNDDNVDDDADKNSGDADSEDSIKIAEFDKDDKSKSLAETTKKKKTVELIIGILCGVSYRMKHASDLCTPDILNTLLRTCRVAFRRKNAQSRWDEHGAPSVLSHIIMETINFVPFIKQDFVFKIYEMTKIVDDHEDCLQCNDLRVVGEGLLNSLKDMAETGYGRGEMAHILLTGDVKMHKQIAVVTTYIISNPKNLHKLLVEHGGLYTIMEIIVTRDADLGAEAATGLTVLAKVLKIAVPSSDGSSIGAGRFDPARRHVTDADVAAGRVVTFIAGPQTGDAVDENVVQFNETILTDASDVFSSMLKSNFRESTDKRIFLPKQTLEGIQYFLDALRQRSAGNGLLLADAKYMTAVLETYDMCQMYMLRELERDIYNLILCMLSDETVLRVFEFAMANHKPDLSEVAINYYLCADIAGDRKVAMYRAADNSEYFKEWNQMMLDTVVFTCQNLIVNL